MSSKKIVLISSDGESFEVDEAVARQFQILAHMIEDNCADKPIPLQNVTAEDLSLVLVYCKRHVEADVSVEGEDKDTKKTKLESWDAEYMKGYDLAEIFKILLSANYLNVKGLLDLAAQTVADRIKDKTVEEVRIIFNAENDYTEEEEKAARKENAWAFH